MADFVIITRFNYRFKESDPIGPLIEQSHWDKRLALFKRFCFASVVGQIDPNFNWIIIIDSLLPENHKNQLTDLITSHYQSLEYNSKGPRKIILHPWNYRDSLSKIDWFCDNLNEKLLITSRLDSDDALAKDFTKTLRHLGKSRPIKGFLIVSYAQGYTWNECSEWNSGNTLSKRNPRNSWNAQNACQQSTGDIFKATRQPLIAIGLSVIADTTRYPLTAYCGRHTRLLTYLKAPGEHSIFKPLYERNNELNLSRVAASALARQRYLIVRTGPPMYIRTIHDSNLQKNLVRVQRAPDLTEKIQKRFTILF